MTGSLVPTRSEEPAPFGPAVPRFRVRGFHPAPWAPGAHLQTLAGKLLRRPPPMPFARERWNTPDGDFLDLDLGPQPVGRGGPGNPAAAPIALVLHGLEGSSARGYVRVACHHLFDRGLWPVAVNFRSCSGEPNRLPRAYHSGETGDLAWVLARLSLRFPGRPIGVLGFSLGGNVLLKLLGELGEEARGLVRAAAAVSVPFDLAAGAAQLESSPMGRLYATWFLRSLRRKMRSKEALLRGNVPLDRVLSASTLRRFDDLATAPLHGFPDAEAYYRESSSLQFLPDVRVPTLLVQSADDPFQPPGSLPSRAVARNPSLVAAFVEGGGHVGFVEGTLSAPRFWAEEEASRFLATGLLGAGGCG